MSINSHFLKQLEKENETLEQELSQLLKKQQESMRFSFSSNENQCPNYKNDELSRIDEEMEEEIPNRIEPQRMHESPQRCDSTIDNLMDSINNYMHKRRSSQTEPQSQRQSETKRNEQEQNKIKSLEMRLSGTREALKSLEKEVKDKNLIIQNLQIELNRKQKQIDQLNKSTSPHNQRIVEQNNQSNNSNESFQELKKQCKEWEKKYLENESQLKENKKYMQRLQELNQQLLHKLKNFEQDKEIHNEEIDEISISLQKYENTIKQLQEQVNIEKDKYKRLDDKYNELKLSSEQFLLNSRELKIQYEHMLNTLQQVANHC